jgi:hypothetical protein
MGQQYTEHDIRGALTWLGHGGNAGIAMGCECLEDLDEHLFGEDELFVLRQALEVLGALVPEPVKDAACEVHRRYEGELQYEIEQWLKGKSREEEQEE